jgi:Ca2+-binding EF-hand superfamily protein
MPDWESVKANLPVGTSQEDKERRKALWRSFHVTHSQYLALFEVDAAMSKVLQCQELFDAKPVIRKAYKYARVANPNGPKDKLEFCEFRLLLVYLKGIFDVYQIFMTLDESKDKVLQLEELHKAGPRLEAAGIQVKDPDSLWRQLKGTNEVVDFTEFADWAVQQGLAGPELLEQVHQEESAVGNELKAVMQKWRCCSEGTATVADLQRLMKKLDPSFPDQELSGLLTPFAVEGRVNLSAFIDDILTVSAPV